MEQKKLHVLSILVFVLLVICFYVLGGGTAVEEDTEEEAYFNTSLPDANVEELSEDRLKAIYKAEQLNKEQQRKHSRQRTSFEWFTENDKVSSAFDVEDTLVTEETIEEEKVETPRRVYSKKAKPQLSDRELFELEKQAILEKKRRELEAKLGLTLQKKEESQVTEKRKSNIVVGASCKNGFYGLPETENVNKSDIRALVHGDYKNISSGAVVKFRIIDEFTIDGIHIPKNTFLYGQLSFSSGRAMIRIENIQYKNKVIPFSASIYDQDGFKGLYTPDNLADEAKRKVGNDVISSTNLNISTGIPIINTAANAVTSAIKSISQSAVREQKLSISSNYQVNIRYE